MKIPYATEIMPELFIGNIFACWQLSDQITKYIGIIHLCACRKGAAGQGLYVPIDEHSTQGGTQLLKYLPQMIAYTQKCRHDRMPVLFHCKQGICRSPSAAFLVCRALGLFSEPDQRAQFKRWYPLWQASKEMDIAIQQVLKAHKE